MVKICSSTLLCLLFLLLLSSPIIGTSAICDGAQKCIPSSSVHDNFSIVHHRSQFFAFPAISHTRRTAISAFFASTDGNVWLRRQFDSPGFRPRVGAAFVSHLGTLYRVGGAEYLQDGSYHVYSDVWSSQDGASWRVICASCGWPKRVGHSVMSVGGKLFLWGGETTNIQYADVWIASAAADSWHKVYDKASPTIPTVQNEWEPLLPLLLRSDRSMFACGYRPPCLSHLSLGSLSSSISNQPNSPPINMLRSANSLRAGDSLINSAATLNQPLAVSLNLVSNCLETVSKSMLTPAPVDDPEIESTSADLTCIYQRGLFSYFLYPSMTADGDFAVKVFNLPLQHGVMAPERHLLSYISGNRSNGSVGQAVGIVVSVFVAGIFFLSLISAIMDILLGVASSKIQAIASRFTSRVGLTKFFTVYSILLQLQFISLTAQFITGLPNDYLDFALIFDWSNVQIPTPFPLDLSTSDPLRTDSMKQFIGTSFWIWFIVLLVVVLHRIALRRFKSPTQPTEPMLWLKWELACLLCLLPGFTLSSARLLAFSEYVTGGVLALIFAPIAFIGICSWTLWTKLKRHKLATALPRSTAEDVKITVQTVHSEVASQNPTRGSHSEDRPVPTVANTLSTVTLSPSRRSSKNLFGVSSSLNSSSSSILSTKPPSRIGDNAFFAVTPSSPGLRSRHRVSSRPGKLAAVINHMLYGLRGASGSAEGSERTRELRDESITPYPLLQHAPWVDSQLTRLNVCIEHEVWGWKMKSFVHIADIDSAKLSNKLSRIQVNTFYFDLAQELPNISRISVGYLRCSWATFYVTLKTLSKWQEEAYRRKSHSVENLRLSVKTKHLSGNFVPTYGHLFSHLQPHGHQFLYTLFQLFAIFISSTTVGATVVRDGYDALFVLLVVQLTMVGVLVLTKPMGNEVRQRRELWASVCRCLVLICAITGHHRHDLSTTARDTIFAILLIVLQCLAVAILCWDHIRFCIRISCIGWGSLLDGMLCRSKVESIQPKSSQMRSPPTALPQLEMVIRDSIQLDTIAEPTLMSRESSFRLSRGSAESRTEPFHELRPSNQQVFISVKMLNDDRLVLKGRHNLQIVCDPGVKTCVYKGIKIPQQGLLLHWSYEEFADVVDDDAYVVPTRTSARPVLCLYVQEHGTRRPIEPIVLTLSEKDEPVKKTKRFCESHRLKPDRSEAIALFISELYHQHKEKGTTYVMSLISFAELEAKVRSVSGEPDSLEAVTPATSTSLPSAPSFTRKNTSKRTLPNSFRGLSVQTGFAPAAIHLMADQLNVALDPSERVEPLREQKPSTSPKVV